MYTSNENTIKKEQGKEGCFENDFKSKKIAKRHILQYIYLELSVPTLQYFEYWPQFPNVDSNKLHLVQMET